MCRFVAYAGPNLLLEEVLVKPSNSIVMQSLHARETDVRTNGDGFGLGWYTPDIDHYPGLFRSIFPAWNDSNLLHITAKIKSPCFFAHVRSATVGGANTNNCHPFIYKQWMMMHNGQIQDFINIKRHLRHLLDDNIYNWIQGETDSEHLFALFLQMAKGRDLTNISEVAEVLLMTLSKVLQLVKQYGCRGGDGSYFNICLTNGQELVATRYCSDQYFRPESLHFLVGNLLSKDMYKRRKMDHDYVLIASERLNEFSSDWEDIPANHLLLVSKERAIELKPIDF